MPFTALSQMAPALELQDSWTDHEGTWVVVRLPFGTPIATLCSMVKMSPDVGSEYTLWEACTLDNGDGVELVFFRPIANN